MRFADLDPTDVVLLERLARLTHEASARHAPNWLPTLEHAREELEDATQEGHHTRVAFDDDGAPLGWISTFHLYSVVWEIHPLVVDVRHQRRGCGTQLVADAEAVAAAHGCGVMFVSTSDETGSTSLSGRDLYQDPLGAMARITFAPGHAVGFWLRTGYTLTGIIPDAEGPGCPSIQFTKRLG